MATAESTTRREWDDDERAPPSWHPAQGCRPPSPTCVARDVLVELARARDALAWDWPGVAFRDYSVEPVLPDATEAEAATAEHNDANNDAAAATTADVDGDGDGDDDGDGDGDGAEVNGDLANDGKGYAYI